jgi:hypothetical protein
MKMRDELFVLLRQRPRSIVVSGWCGISLRNENDLRLDMHWVILMKVALSSLNETFNDRSAKFQCNLNERKASQKLGGDSEYGHFIRKGGRRKFWKQQMIHDMKLKRTVQLFMARWPRPYWLLRVAASGATAA